MNENNVRRLQIDPNEGNEKHPYLENSSLARSRFTLYAILAAVALVTLTSGATYAAVLNNWVSEITGTIHQEAEYNSAVSHAFNEGQSAGYDDGHSTGLSDGEFIGFVKGEKQGYQRGEADGYRIGYQSGLDEGYVVGYDEGYPEGWADGCEALFDGLGTDRVGDWWDYYYGANYAYYYTRATCY